MKTAKFFDYYKDEKDGELIKSCLDVHLLDALADGVEGLFVTKAEFKEILGYAIYARVYELHHTIADTGDSSTDYCVLGMKLIII